MKNLLVTGGCGFIGANFVRLVLESEDWRVINLDQLTYAGNLENLKGLEDHPRYQFIHGDICDQQGVAELFRREQVDAVVHFAAESHVDRSILGPDAFIRTNVQGTLSLLNGAREYWLGEGGQADGQRFVHISTDEVYGSLGEQGLFSETTPYDPRSPYSASKAASDHLARAYYHTYGLPVLVTNCSNNYGPYQFPEKLIPLTINNCLLGRPLPVYGDGGNVRDWLHVHDHCAAIVRVLKTGRPGSSYNIGGHNEKTNIEVVRLLCDLVDERVGPMENGQARQSLITFVKDRLGHDRRYAIDASKIAAELGWRPKFSFAQGISATVDWYLENRPWIEAIIDGSYQQYYHTMYGGR
ncbi:MAG: dTDP-glucose 4,6-dehydratase [Desulfobulbus propionicus]|nr:MAG: dTDP-glucose 4,6-dehydratase [Desulfobulbus propionicus]